MRHFIGCDAHKKYSVFVALDEKGSEKPAVRVQHNREQYRAFLRGLPAGSEIAVETIGNWYWIVDEMREAGHAPRLAHARKAKLMMGEIDKTDKLDARGLAVLLRNRTLPEVWIPPGEVRDQRELLRLRMTLVGMEVGLKNRIHAILAKYAIELDVNDVFSKKGRRLLLASLKELPVETTNVVRQQVELLESTEKQREVAEERLGSIMKERPDIQLLRTLPGVGWLLATVIAFEIGEIGRFNRAEELASYSGTVPRVHSSGGKTWYGRVHSDVNRYLKWAFVEAANVIVMHQKRLPQSHVVGLYRRLRQRKGHAKAATAVARHLAEAAFWVLKRQQPYKEPQGRPRFVHAPVSARCSMSPRDS
jgi:transposase